MAGHNKWAQIKHKKAITDAKKNKIFSKLARYISVEARLSSGKDSPGLRAAIEKARKVNMTNDVIERAIKKATEPGANLEMHLYEAYGPGGVGIIIETLTENKNRVAQEIKHVLSKNGFALGGIHSVAWNFTKENTPEGQIWKPNMLTPLSDTDLELLDKLVDELEELDDVQEIFTSAE